MSWLLLILAGLFEIGWAVGLKTTDGFTGPLPTTLTLASMAASVYLLSMAVREIPVGTAYAVWTGIGAIGTVAVAAWVYHEPTDWRRLVCIALIAAGILGLKLTAPAPTAEAGETGPAGAATR